MVVCGVVLGVWFGCVVLGGVGCVDGLFVEKYLPCMWFSCIVVISRDVHMHTRTRMHTHTLSLSHTLTHSWMHT